MNTSTATAQTAATSATWRRHDGKPALAEPDYLVPPDSRIGSVSSAETNRSRVAFYEVDRPYRRKVLEIALAALLLGTVAGGFLVGASHPLDLLPWSDTLGALQKATVYAVAIVSAIVAHFVAVALRSRRSTYVGSRGLQQHTKLVLGPGKTEAMRFADAARLQVERTRQLLNGAYQGTVYEYRWVDAQGKPVFVIAGRYDDRSPPLSSDPFLFAVAAEEAWQAARGAP